MRILGNILLGLGAIIGAGASLAMLGGGNLSGIPLVMGIVLVKMGFLWSACMMTAGAVVLRLDRRAQERRALERSEAPGQLRP